MNVVDWFDDNSHGHIEISGNAVFGWLELAETLQRYNDRRGDGTYARRSSTSVAQRQQRR
jgi:hypothetical protein